MARSGINFQILKMSIKAEYKCLKCGCKWKEVLRGPTQCPMCNHLYVKWVNYQELYKAIFRKDTLQQDEIAHRKKDLE